MKSLRHASHPKTLLDIFLQPKNAQSLSTFRHLHQTRPEQATTLPVTRPGPPPPPPESSISDYREHIARRQQQRNAILRGQTSFQAKRNHPNKSDNAAAAAQTPLRRRFWKDVLVKEVPEGYQIHLDTRPVRTASKTPLTIPRGKRQLANAIALEWDLLTTAQQALKQHFIPLTSLVGRAEQIKEHDGIARTNNLTANSNKHVRNEIVEMVMRYLDTDTLLCWSPELSTTNSEGGGGGGEGDQQHAPKTLRELQIQTARPIIHYLTTHIWPGVEIHLVSDASNSIIPASQPQSTKDVIRGWISNLPAYELAGLERAVLAGKGLLGAVRLLVEWSEVFRCRHEQRRPPPPIHQQQHYQQRKRFGVEEAAQAASLEVTWQTSMWGEVEDTHDVEREDLRRQLGSVILLVAGDDDGDGEE